MTFCHQPLELKKNILIPAEVWYNVGHIGLALGDTSLAYQCFRLALSANNNHAEAFNNLAVLELRKGNVDQVLSSRNSINNAKSNFKITKLIASCLINLSNSFNEHLP